MELNRYKPGLRVQTYLGSGVRALGIVGDSIATKKTIEMLDLVPAFLPLATQHLLINQLHKVKKSVQTFRETENGMELELKKDKALDIKKDVERLGTRLTLHTLTVNGTTALVAAGQTVNAFVNVKTEPLDPLTALVPLGLFLLGSFILFRADKGARDMYNQMVNVVSDYQNEHPQLELGDPIAKTRYQTLPAYVKDVAHRIYARSHHRV